MKLSKNGGQDVALSVCVDLAVVVYLSELARSNTDKCQTSVLQSNLVKADYIQEVGRFLDLVVLVGL